MQLSELGTVLSRQVSIVDLEQALRQQRARIVRLKVFIARATEQLKTDLPADVRLRLQLQFQEARAELARATRANKADAAAAFSRVVADADDPAARDPAPKGGAAASSAPPEMPARSSRAPVRSILFLLIVLSPLIVLIVASVVGCGPIGEGKSAAC